MKRSFFLAPEVQVARQVVSDLKQAGVDERHIHAIAGKGVELEEVPRATLLQRSNFLPALEQGAAIGGIFGLMGGLVAMAFPVEDLVIAGGILLEWMLAGAGVGGTVFSLVGASASNEQVRQFQAAIASGQILLMLDVPDDRAQEFIQRVQTQSPAIQFAGEGRAAVSV